MKVISDIRYFLNRISLKNNNYAFVKIDANEIILDIDKQERGLGWQSLYELIENNISMDVEKTALMLKENFTERQVNNLIELLQK